MVGRLIMFMMFLISLMMMAMSSILFGFGVVIGDPLLWVCSICGLLIFFMFAGKSGIALTNYD